MENIKYNILTRAFQDNIQWTRMLILQLLPSCTLKGHNSPIVDIQDPFSKSLAFYYEKHSHANFSTQTIIPHLQNKNRISGSLLPYKFNQHGNHAKGIKTFSGHMYRLYISKTVKQ